MRYIIHEIVLERETDGVSYYRVTDWEPIHSSEEPDPADPTVGHGRSDNDEETVIPLSLPNVDENVKQTIEKFNRSNEKKGLKILLTNNNQRSENKMTEEERLAKEAADREAKEKLLKADRDAAREAETIRVNSIYGLAADFQRNLPGINLKDEAEKYIADPNKSDRDFMNFIREKMKSPEALRTPDNHLGMSEKEKKVYSLRNIILSLAQRDVSGLKVELEASKTIADRLNRPQGKDNIFIPYDVMVRQLPELMKKEGKRDITIDTGTGGYTVHSQYPAGSFIEILMNAMVTPKLGIDIWENLVGNIPMTRELSSNIFYWVAESNGPTQSDLTWGQETMSPKTGGCLTKFSHKFLIQNSVGGEAYVTRKLALSTGLGYDSAVINGTGLNNQPKGLRAQTGLGGVVGTGFTRAKAIDMIKQIKAANALVLGTPKWLTDPVTWAILKGIDTTEGGFGKWLLDDNGNMLEYPAIDSNQVTTGDLFGGIWSALILGMWGVTEIKANEFGSGFAAGDIEVRSLMDMDVYVAYPGAFAKAANVSA